MQLYADIFFLYNLIMDYLVLKITAVLWGIRSEKLFLWCTAANICYIAAVFFAGISPVMPCFFLACAVLFSLRPKKTIHFIGIIITAYAVTFLLGSIGLGLMALFGANALFAAAPAVLLLYLLDRLKSSAKLSAVSGLYPLEISTEGKSINLTALCDSGNGLRIANEPVIIVDKTAAGPLMPYIADMFKHSCRTVSGEGELTCFYAMARIGRDMPKRTCIAISGTPMDGDFDSLINAEILDRIS